MRDGRTPPRNLTIKHTSNVEDVRSIATRKLPMAVKDFIEGGAEDEITLNRNRDAFQAIQLRLMLPRGGHANAALVGPLLEVRHPRVRPAIWEVPP